MLKLSDFDYDLPKELIAQYPLRERDMARLLVINRKEKTIEHRAFKDLVNYFSKDDLFALNDTKVLHCRLEGRRKTGGKVQALLLKQKEGLTFKALIKPSRIKFGERIIFNGGTIYAEMTARDELTFYAPDIDAVYRQAQIPLPPYIKRAPQDLDSVYYQTVFAQREGSIAAPTAGLHFTPGFITEIESSGINIAYITLHINYPTFKPVKTEDITSHKMDKEYFCIDEQAQDLLKKTVAHKGRIFAVGTTSVRALETYILTGLKESDTDLFIYPGYKFKIIDCLLTNFHLPRTTLFMLVCAFCAAGASASGGAGIELVKKAYQEAIDKKYRFYSYGDAMLII
ncbi:MAG: tRNA preQ1(34) S-adenosylmethionine ribosyltransferase-isomerase QueA [Candidatus Omnitrophica bacterium]|nr:tRNA preQ1(34) S-adenosylmethionine ribosyltransferase-isomerase QueA [Candidatus Omnitrophota bacterium]